MKLYALFTLHETGWGTRTGIGDRKSFVPGTRSSALTFTAAIATAAQEKQGEMGADGPMHGEARGGMYDVETNGMKARMG